MTEKRYRLTQNNFLSPEAINALLEKERLIKGDIQPQHREEIHSDNLIPSCSYHSGNAYYCFYGWEVSDSAAYASWAEVYVPSRQMALQFESDPFGDEAKLKAIYAEFAEEEVALANEGLAEFRQVMKEYDGE